MVIGPYEMKRLKTEHAKVAKLHAQVHVLVGRGRVTDEVFRTQA